MLALGQISSGVSNLLVLELTQNEIVVSTQSTPHSLITIASRPLKAEPTTIHCWAQSSRSDDLIKGEANLNSFFCCVGTLEPAVLVFQITTNGICEIYSESLSKCYER